LSRILVVDDDSEIRLMLRRLFERFGYEVVDASDGDIAIAMQRDTPADLVITDIIMPNKEGIETIMQMRVMSPGTKIIAMSGGGFIHSGEYLDIANKCGALRTFDKPFNMNDLLGAVREILGEPAGPETESRLSG
jgi:DNA-binding NtrC family response regulator